MIREAQPPTPLEPDPSYDAPFERLSDRGWVVLPDFLSGTLNQKLYQEALQGDAWTPAGVGAKGQLHSNIRNDSTRWLTGSTPPQTQYLDRMEALRLQVNRHFYAGLFEYEAHFSHYPPGGFYRKHIDAIRGSSARVLTSVYYLNPLWRQEDGGELIIYNPTDTQIEARVQPAEGHLVLFWSDRFPHEVLASNRDRYAIAGWFRRNTDSANPL